MWGFDDWVPWRQSKIKIYLISGPAAGAKLHKPLKTRTNPCKTNFLSATFSNYRLQFHHLWSFYWKWSCHQERLWYLQFPIRQAKNIFHFIFSITFDKIYNLTVCASNFFRLSDFSLRDFKISLISKSM